MVSCSAMSWSHPLSYKACWKILLISTCLQVLLECVAKFDSHRVPWNRFTSLCACHSHLSTDASIRAVMWRDSERWAPRNHHHPSRGQCSAASLADSSNF